MCKYWIMEKEKAISLLRAAISMIEKGADIKDLTCELTNEVKEVSVAEDEDREFTVVAKNLKMSIALRAEKECRKLSEIINALESN